MSISCRPCALAYARAEAEPVLGCPATEPVGVDSTFFAQVLLDVMIKYHSRVVRCVSRLSSTNVLQWIQHRDEAESSLWVEQYRSGAATLGFIIRDTYDRREASWVVDDAPTQAHPIQSGPPHAPRPGPPALRPTQPQGPPPGHLPKGTAALTLPPPPVPKGGGRT